MPPDCMVVLCEDVRGNGAAAGLEGRPVDPLLIFAVISVSFRSRSLSVFHQIIKCLFTYVHVCPIAFFYRIFCFVPT